MWNSEFAGRRETVTPDQIGYTGVGEGGGLSSSRPPTGLSFAH